MGTHLVWMYNFKDCPIAITTDLEPNKLLKWHFSELRPIANLWRCRSYLPLVDCKAPCQAHRSKTPWLPCHSAPVWCPRCFQEWYSTHTDCPCTELPGTRPRHLGIDLSLRQIPSWLLHTLTILMIQHNVSVKTGSQKLTWYDVGNGMIVCWYPDTVSEGIHRVNMIFPGDKSLVGKLGGWSAFPSWSILQQWWQQQGGCGGKDGRLLTDKSCSEVVMTLVAIKRRGGNKTSIHFTASCDLMDKLLMAADDHPRQPLLSGLWVTQCGKWLFVSRLFWLSFDH